MSQNQTKLSPEITLRDIFGEDVVINARASSSDHRWLPKNLDFLTGPPLTIAGNLPVICSCSVATAEIISLFERAALKITPTRYLFDTDKKYRDLIDDLTRQKKKMVINYAYPSSEINQEVYWINPQLLRFLNNKANLERLVPEEYIPRRTIISSDQIVKVADDFGTWPLVIKAATDQPTGGGLDVVICTNKKDIHHACSHFQTCSTVVLEEYIDIIENYNIQFAGTVDDRIIYLGASEQISEATGLYVGNWLTRNHQPPQLLVDLGRSMMDTACSMGFIGIVGFDIVVAKDKRVLTIDLNFRLNGSTPGLLLQESIMNKYKASVLLARSWKPSIAWRKFLPLCQKAIDRGDLVPVSIYCPAKDSGFNPHLSGILVGSSREEILHKERLLGFSYV